MSAEFIATVGTIPAGDSLKILISTIDSFDWLTGSTSVLGDPQGGTFITGESTHNYAYGGVSNNVSVAVSLINSAGVVRMTNTYTYSVEANHVKTVTYNVGGEDRKSVV